MYVLETKQVRIIDEYLCVNGYTIMELISLAGNAFYKHVSKYDHPLIIAGFGNNGADGLMVAKLFMKDQKEVDVYAYKKELMNQNCKELSEGIHFIDRIDLSKYDVIIDGVFGAGLNRKIEDDLATIFEQVNLSNLPKYSIDIPSGINGDGIVYEHYFHCDQVITFMALKKIYLIDELKKFYQEVIVEPLGIDPNVFEINHIAKLIDPEYVMNHLKKRHYNDYKNKNGVCLHITGSNEYTGASIMAAQGSIYSGIGILKVCSTPDCKLVMNNRIPEAVFVDRSTPLHYQEDAVLIGCGLSMKEDSIKLVEDVVKNCTKPLVIDADGINIIANHMDYLSQLQCSVIFTPHLGEYRRLDPNMNVLEFVRKYHCTVILKGPNTLVVNEDHTYMNSTGNLAMATGGSGDTLAGMVVSFLAQGYTQEEACNLAVYFHGLAGDSLFNTYYNVLPSDLAKQVSIEMRKMEKEIYGK